MQRFENELIDERIPGEITRVKREKIALHDEEKKTATVLYKTLFYRQTRLFDDGHEVTLLSLIKDLSPKISKEVYPNDEKKADSLAKRLPMKALYVFETLKDQVNSCNQLIVDKSISAGHRKLVTKKSEIKAFCPEITTTNEWTAIFKIFDKLAIIKPAKVHNVKKDTLEKCYLLNFLYCATRIEYSMDIIKPFFDFNRPWLQRSIKEYLDYYYGEGHKEKDINDKTICDYTGLNYNDLVGTEEAQAG